MIAEALGVPSVAMEWLAGDGSDRCYYRIRSPDLPSSLVLMQLSGSDAEALKSGGYDWINIATLLEGQGIFVPRVSTTLPNHAALLIEDYGNQMLEGIVLYHLQGQRFADVRALYRQCSGLVARFLGIPRTADSIWCKRGFDAERFTWELNFFMQKYGRPVAGIVLTSAEEAQFARDVLALSTALAANSQYFVHRDFHSRNIMVKGEKLAVIDFQDARLGPASYDLVSLCFDSYVPLSGVARRQLLEDGLEVIRKTQSLHIYAEAEALWRPMLLQRQLKAIGSFGFLTLDKQRGDYLKYVPSALATIEEQNVEDPRWPFISGPLIQRLRTYLDQVGHAPRA